MPGIGTQAQRPRKCWACARNQHKNCDHHMNDGAVDAEEFIAVRCDCVCEGKIGREYDSLIEMVVAYKTMVDESEQKARTQSMLAAKSAATADEALELIRAFMSHGYDDEGNLVQDRKGKTFEKALGRLTAGLEQLAAEQEAVFSQLMNGDQFSKIGELIRMLFEDHRDEETKARDKEAHKPFWERTWDDGSDDELLQFNLSMGRTDITREQMDQIHAQNVSPTQAEVESRMTRGPVWGEVGDFFSGKRVGRQPVMNPDKVIDDWAEEGGNPSRKDEGWPEDD